MVREALTFEMLRALPAGEAAACFVARRADGWTDGEQRLLADWLSADESHRRAYEAADRAWRVFDGAEDDEILAAMRAHALAPRRPAWMGWRPAAAAAAVVLAAGVALLFAPGLEPSLRHGGAPAATPAATFQYASTRGEVKSVRLMDGSELTLDADSAVSGAFGSKARAITLARGRAFFAVAKDPSRPFAVTAGDHRVVAVGTRFDVDLAAGTMKVTLQEGRVTVAPLNAAAPPVTLQPGEQLVERDGRTSVRAIGRQIDSALAWRDGLVDFDDQPLAEAVAVMNRYSTDRIVVSDPQVAAIRVSGQFRAGQSERFARTLAELRRLRVVRRGGEIELVRGG